jgi:hypothetical protein
MKIGERTLFVPVNGTDAIIASLDRAVQRRLVCTIIGPTGSSKSATVDHGRHTSDLVRHNEVLHIQLLSSSFSEYRSATHMVYARLLDAVLWQFAPAYLPERSTSEKQTNQFGKRQLERLRIDLRKELHRRPIRAIVVDNIHFADQHALSWTVDLRFGSSDLEPCRALILVGQKKKQKKEENQITGWLKKNSNAVAGWLEKHETAHLTDEELAGEEDDDAPPGVLAHIQDKLLNAVMAKEPDNLANQVGEMFQQANGDWKRIERLVILFDLKLPGRQGDERRVITQNVVDEVKAHLKWLDR